MKVWLKLKKAWESFKKLVENKINYWYIVAMFFVLVEILNYGFLSMVVAPWICTLITIVFLCVLTVYIFIAFNYVKNKYKTFIEQRDAVLYKKIEDVIVRLDETELKFSELANNISQELKNKLEETKEENIREVGKAIEDATNCIKNYTESTCNNIENRICQEISHSDDLLNKNADSINKNITNNFIEIKNNLSDSRKENIESKEFIVNELHNIEKNENILYSNNTDSILKWITSNTENVNDRLKVIAANLDLNIEKQATDTQKLLNDIDDKLTVNCDEIKENIALTFEKTSDEFNLVKNDIGICKEEIIDKISKSEETSEGNLKSKVSDIFALIEVNTEKINDNINSNIEEQKAELQSESKKISDTIEFSKYELSNEISKLIESEESINKNNTVEILQSIIDNSERLKNAIAESEQNLSNIAQENQNVNYSNDEQLKIILFENFTKIRIIRKSDLLCNILQILIGI